MPSLPTTPPMAAAVPSGPARRWPLAALAGGVLLAHAWLLAAPLLPGEPGGASTPAPAPVALQTRSVVLPGPVQPALSAMPPAPRPRAAAPTRPTLAPASLLPPAEPPESAPSPEPAAPPVEAEAVPIPPDLPVAQPTPDLEVASADTPSAARVAAAPSLPFDPPPSAQLRYDVKIHYRGIPQTFSGSLDWQHDGRHYRLHMVVQASFLGSRVQTSEGGIGRMGLQPTRFAEKTRSERAAHFDEAGQRIRYSANTPDEPLLPGHQDRLSVFLQLAGLVHARPADYPAGKEIEVPTSGVRDSETWRFVVKGSETLQLPAGEFTALHLQRRPRQEHDTLVDLWLAPARGHLPVRMRLEQSNGDVADQQLALP